jgi:magnesium chelatase subunit I
MEEKDAGGVGMSFPFAAIVGQEEMKTGLILNVIDPSIGGLLIMGEKGTAKSTAVRALAALLPQYTAVKGCRFHCEPGGTLCAECAEKYAAGQSVPTEPHQMRVVELPLGVTEDRLVGTLDIEVAIRKGEKHFEPGLLADANRNFLYVDEVNLLEDHIVDLLLDSAAMGVNTVEREGISFTHPSRFIMVGTMNPEEGDLRPQLLDRFGLCTQVTAVHDKTQRIEILRRKAAYDADPTRMQESWTKQQTELAQKIVLAQQNLAAIETDDETLEKIVHISTTLSLDGHRADIVMMKASRALAAFLGKQKIPTDEIRSAAHLALSHRMKRLPFDEVGAETLRLEELLKEL